MRILIICALPYDISSTTRAFQTYFNNVNKTELSQIYTNTSTPTFENCKSFFRITDKDIIKNLFIRKKEIGTIFNYPNSIEPINNSNNSRKIPHFLKKDLGIIHFFRNLLWAKKNWYSEKLKQWILNFSPDIIFYHNSNSVFLTKVVLTLKHELNIPLVTEISDDYFFNKNNFLSPYNHLYKRKFKELLNNSDGTIFISEKMKNKYSKLCCKNSDYVHICSRENINISNECSLEDRLICFFGNIGLNRYKTISKFSDFLYKNNIGKLDVYCPKIGNSNIKKIIRKPGIKYCGSLAYSQLIKQIQHYQYILIAEPLDKKTAKYISLSLSTKVSDSLLLNKPIIAIGREDSGTIDFLSNNNCAILINKRRDFSNLKAILSDRLKINQIKQNAYRVQKKEFSLENNASKAYNILSNAIINYYEKNK